MTVSDARKAGVALFTAGSRSSDLVKLASQEDSGLRLLTAEDQKRDYYKARCEALSLAAREFFFDYESASSLILEKTRDTGQLPEFVEYVYCWLAEDRLCGFILSGVTSDAGSHEQINQQEAAFWDHASEVAEALSQKYPQTPEVFVNFFNFATYAAQPRLPSGTPADLISEYQELVDASDDTEPGIRLETHFAGPTLLPCVRRPEDSDIATAARTRQSNRKSFASSDYLVLYDVKIERYVRTIESFHVFEDLVYISQKLVDELGRKLNSERCRQIQSQAQAQIDRWNESKRRAEAARAERIRRLSDIL
jgi:hypothetical protein